MKTYDYIIVGAGIVGLTVARVLAMRKLGTVCVLEKEPSIGLHSSGRNSGIIHAGIYYATDSLKAKVCVRGARMLRQYAADRGIPLNKTGKVIVATSPATAPQIDLLYERATSNGIHVEKIDARQLRELEPEAVSHGPALYSPDTAVIDAKAVLETLEKEICGLGVELYKETEVTAVKSDARVLSTTGTEYGYGHLINAAGLHADRLAHQMDVGKRYRIVPFKGIYKKLRPDAAKRFRGSIYPAPNLSVPFLGVHITRTVNDEVIVGPTAIPAFGRENYGLIQGLDVKETPSIAMNLLLMILQNRDGFRGMVIEEFQKYRMSGLLKSVKSLAPSLNKEDILSSGKRGIRAQLVDVSEMKLIMDFVVEKGPASTHILNAVSPAFTGSLAFAEFLVENFIEVL